MVAISQDHARRMARVDGCPECVRNTEPPRRVCDTPGQPGFTADYTCSDCGHRWTTAWLDGPA